MKARLRTECEATREEAHWQQETGGAAKHSKRRDDRNCDRS